MNHKKENKKLKLAIGDWIKAEYAFRYGPFAYQNAVTDEWLKANRKLRRALTGTSDMDESIAFLREVKYQDEQRKQKTA